MFFPTKTLGYGNRLSIWMIGCPHHCFNCSNPELWEENKDKEIPICDILSAIKHHKNDIQGVTITGGEPFHQISELLELLYSLKNFGITDVLVYTGYTIQQLEVMGDSYSQALSLIGVLIDGKYIDEQNDDMGIRGSKNQNITILNGELKEKYESLSFCKRTSQTIVSNGNIISVGIPLKLK